MTYPTMHKIIARIAKENQIYRTILQNYSIKEADKIISQLTSYDYLSLNTVFSYNQALQTIIDNHPKGENCYREFDYSIKLLLLPLINNFIAENDIQGNISSNLMRSLKNHPYNNLNEYYSYFQKQPYNISTFFLRMFSWVGSIEGYVFWNTINYKYNQYIMKTLKCILYENV